MKIGFHKTSSSDCTKGGAIRYYDEISRLFSEERDRGSLDIKSFDLFTILRDPAAFRSELKSCRIIVSNAGPYAFWWHYLRDRLELDFAIYRDIRTTGLSSYLLQEHLCIPLSSPQDRVIFPSNYAWHYYEHAMQTDFYKSQATVLYPLIDFFPALGRKQSSHTDSFNLGVLGRLTSDKNLGDCLQIFVKVQRNNAKARLILAGDFEVSDPVFPNVQRFMHEARRLGADCTRIHYQGHLPYSRIWTCLQSMDVLLFPALSSIESMGRIYLEAAHAKVPVLSADYAAAHEFLPAENLVRPIYNADKRQAFDRPFSFGGVDTTEIVNRITQRKFKEHWHQNFSSYRKTQYLEYLIGHGRGIQTQRALSHETRNFLSSLKIEKDPLPSATDSLKILDETLPFFLRFFDDRFFSKLRLLPEAFSANYSSQERRLLLNKMLAPSMDPMIQSFARVWCRKLGFRVHGLLQPSVNGGLHE